MLGREGCAHVPLVMLGCMVTFTLNGKPVKLDLEPDTLLLWALRGKIG